VGSQYGLAQSGTGKNHAKTTMIKQDAPVETVQHRATMAGCCHEHSDSFIDDSLDMLGITTLRDGRWRWIYVNPSLCQVLGWSSDELLAMACDDILHPNERAAMAAYLQSGRSLERLEQRVRCKDGRFKRISWNLVPAATGGAMYHSGRDVTERRLADELLRAQKQALEGVAAPIPLDEALRALTDIVDQQSDHSAVAAIMLADETGETLRACVGAGLPSWYYKAVDGVRIEPGLGTCAHAAACNEITVTPDIEAAPSWEGLAHLPLALGLKAAWSMPIRGSDNRVLGTLGTYFRECRQPTLWERQLVEGLCHAASWAIERKQAEAALRQEAARKDEFLAVLAHELRNPLAPLRMGLEVLGSRASPEAHANMRAMMERQVDHLVHLVDELLDVSRISRGQIDLQRARIDLDGVVDAAAELSQPLIDARGHELTVRRTGAPLWIDGDHQRLTQVTANLLSNAAKYMNSGGTIHLSTGVEAGQAVLRVSDSGYGIPPERLSEVFDMFVQVPEHRELTGGGGLGIGLALSRQLIALHGGSIVATSQGLGHGSVFVLRLPLALPAPQMADAVPDAGTDAVPRRVLVVDDNADVAQGLRLFLELKGADVQVAADGPAALRAIEARAPEVVLLDIGLPGMSGYEVARRIRALPGGRQMRLYAVTGWGQEDDKRLAKEAGFDEHLTKPINTAVLLKLLATPPPTS